MTALIFLLALQIVFVAFLIYRNRKTGRMTDERIALFASLFLYFSLMVLLFGTSLLLKYRLSTFDLDGDGSFSGAEVTPQMRMALEKSIAYAGKGAALLIGIMYSAGYYLVVLVLMKLLKKKNSVKIKKLDRQTTNAHL